ncbi:RNA polymerase II C-terminal domain phosphatase-like 3 [Bienertia sinuspersici]
MGSNVRMKVDGGEEGEIPDPDAIVEISKEEFKPSKQHQQQQQSTSKTTTSKPEFWMGGMFGYGGASGLYNIAWAQAVQNKPLNDVFVKLKKGEADDKNNNANNNSTSNKATDDTAAKEQDGQQQQQRQSVNNATNEVAKMVDTEKEEGELEEGEIDLDSEDSDNNNNNNGNKVEDDFSGMEREDIELENQVSSIRKVLHNVTAAEAHKSFDIVCARLKSSLESLKDLVLHTWFPSKDALIQQSFDAIQCVYTVYSSMSPTLKDQNKDRMSRLLTFVLGFNPPLFTPEQRKEVEGMNADVNPPVVSVKSKPMPKPNPKPKLRDKQEELAVTEKAILTDSNTLTVNSGDNNSDYLKTVGTESPVYLLGDKNNTDILSDAMRQLPSNIKTKSGFSFGPLLDLHKVHDEDSLPSPTSKTMPSLPFCEAAPPRVVHGLQKSGVHPYETDALKAVSSYQQRFVRSTFLATDRLPSPTPSGDGDDGGADDSNEEVSSSTPYNNIVSRNISSSVMAQPVVSSAVPSSPSIHGVVSVTGAGVSSAGSSSLRVSAKSRDPRLRHLNPSSGSLDLSFCPSPSVPSSGSKLEPLGEIMNSKKSKALEGSLLNVPAAKRLRSGLETEEMSTNANQVKFLPGSTGVDTSRAPGSQFASRGFLGPVNDPRKPGSGIVSSGTNPSVTMNTTAQSVLNVNGNASLQSLLKGIAGNTAAWMNIVNEQKKSNESLQSVSHSANPSSILGAAPSPTTTGAGLLQVPSQTAVTNPLDEVSKLRMKPRDPRRVLHANSAQRTSSSASEPKINGVYNTTTQGLQDNSQWHVNGISPSAASSQTPVLPDITKQFTKNLKNIADLISAPQTSSVQSSVAISSPPSTQVNFDGVSVSSAGPASSSFGGLLNPGDQKTGSAARLEEIVTRRPEQNNWGEVEHLFDGFDDQQKAAIQQERTRRLDEQNKMFSARKLCLVLDLDHTLLNSAKFMEVDPVHDGILRMKEEQDREMPRRHLFRFPHMAMWTKLRPGIWNFLERASKLYELHLYTMGNKLYATEMAKVLDPKGSLFAGRVISRGDDGDPVDGDERVPKSKDLEGVLGMESSVVIIDDSARVWPHNKLNLIVVERYTYFPCSRKQFGLSGPSLLEIDRDERPEAGTLASSLAVIERIHQNFFAQKSLEDVDVRNILAAEQRKILAGCRILFSRVFPVGEASPHLHPLWQTAEQFGASCTNQIDEQVTHVVANSPGTDKVNWARSTGRYVVHPGWVEASALLYRRANEQEFAIKF